MSGPADALGMFAGATGVGALGLLGAFLILDSRAPSLFPTVEQYAKTATWSVVVAVPVLAISYLIGLFFVAASEQVLQLTYGPPQVLQHADLVRLAVLDSGSSILVQEFVQLKQERAALGGSALALVFICFGAWGEVRNLPSLRWVVRTLALGALVLAVALFHAAGLKGQAAHALAESYSVPSSAPGITRK